MKASASLKSLAASSLRSSVPPPAFSLKQVLSRPVEEVKEAQELAKQLQHHLAFCTTHAPDISTVLLNHSDAWKLYANHKSVIESLFIYFNAQKKGAAYGLYMELLMKGTLHQYRRIFTETQCESILGAICRFPLQIPWRTVNIASVFMKSQNYTDPYILDQFTSRYLNNDVPIESLVDYLHVTYQMQPINFELEWLCRRRLKDESISIPDRLVLKSLILLLKSQIRGDMLTYLSLLKRIDIPFVQRLKDRQIVVCLGVLAKSRSKQLFVDERVFQASAKRCKELLESADSKMLFIIGQALSQVNFGENEYFSLLKQRAEETKQKVEYLDFLERTVSPTLESL